MFACLFVSVWSIQAISLKTGFQLLDVFLDYWMFFFFEKRKWQTYVSFGI